MISSSQVSQWSLGWPELTTQKDDLTLALLTILAITLTISWFRSFCATSLLPPGPRGLPIVGYLPFLRPNLHHEFNKLAQRYGPVFKLKLGGKTLIVVSSSDLAKVVLREQDDIFANRDPPLAGAIISYGCQDILFSNNNSYWRNLRKVLVSEVLSNKNVEGSRIFRVREARKTVNYVYGMIGSEVNIRQIAFFTSLRVVTNMLWGTSLVEDEKSNNINRDFEEVITNIVELVGRANLSDFFPILSRLDLQGIERDTKQELKTMDGIFEDIIEGRIMLYKTKSKEAVVVEQEGKKDFLQILLEYKNQNTTATSFNITQIKALFMNIVSGGTDTTSTMVEWTMAELLQNPTVMKKVQDELEEVVGLNNIVEESHLSKLHHLDAVIKETLRLHPPLPLLITRCPSQSCNVGGYTIPKGSDVYLNVWSIHRDPKYWDNPSEFNYNRFLNLDSTTKYDYNGNNFNFLPFGSGRRRCPGIPLGDKMLVYFLASLLHSFNWALPSGKEHELSSKFGIVLKKREPLIAIPSQRLSSQNLYM
uniref:geraniol 8-hydroxylase-like n=1 Tax=Erigeron canadensis TaxID=72917 RepID=UPI001CB9CCF4|nr:geraniol 8-hydroxylase-like [Erigeron canadensis]